MAGCDVTRDLPYAEKAHIVGERERERGALLPGLQTAARLLRTALQHLSDRNILSVCQMQNFGALVRRAT